MARSKKFTTVVIPQIQSWVTAGLSTVEIAEKIGCTLGTLRVRCSQLGISLRRGRSAEKSLLVSMSRVTAQEFQNQAASKGISGSTLAATLLQKIVQDDLYEAVLDEVS